MYWIGICDDEKACRKKIRESFNKYCMENDIKNCEIFEYSSGEEISNYDELDILFLDVQMKSMDGIHVKEKLESERSKTKIIFISSYSEHMQEAFGTNVIGFLKKPLDYRQFCEKVVRAIDRCKEDSRYIFYNEYGKSRKLYINDILYIKSYDRYTEIHIDGERSVLLSEKSMKYYKKELVKDFEKSQRSYLVNLKYVREVDEEVVLENGELLPISRRRRTIFTDRFKKSIWGED